MMTTKKLYRSQTERMIAGVCGGIAEYSNLDPTIVRLLFILLLFLGGNGLLVYLILMIVMPLGPAALNPGQPENTDSSSEQL